MVVHTMEFQNDHFSFRAKRQFKKAVMHTIFSNRIKSAGVLGSYYTFIYLYSRIHTYMHPLYMYIHHIYIIYTSYIHHIYTFFTFNTPLNTL